MVVHIIEIPSLLVRGQRTNIEDLLNGISYRIETIDDNNYYRVNFFEMIPEEHELNKIIRFTYTFKTTMEKEELVFEYDKGFKNIEGIRKFTKHQMMKKSSVMSILF